jgi:hypothetical protein
LAFSSDGKYLASTSIDGTARCGTHHQGRSCGYTGPSGPFFDVAFSPDDKYVIVSGQGLVYGYVLDLDELVRLAYTRLTRWFTPMNAASFARETCRMPAMP